jgi:hypothetical protein
MSSLRRWSEEEQLVAEVPLPMVQVTAEPTMVRFPLALSVKAEMDEVAE